MNLEHIRREYLLSGLRREHLNGSPFAQFSLWMQQAVAAQIPDPTAMVLATVDANGQPDQRIVLLKQFDDQGLVFYTNYGSKKAQDMAINTKVSVHFPWHFMERQVRVMGIAQKLSATESLKYFLTRPYESQIAAWSSQQSRPISARQLLLTQFEHMKAKFAEGKVPLPDFWGGYRISPTQFEFWQGGGHRLHDRFEYTKTDSMEWNIRRLAP